MTAGRPPPRPRPDAPRRPRAAAGGHVAGRHAEIDSPEVLYWRTTTGEEVDLVIEWKGQLLPIEVKSGTRPRLGDTKGLRAFRGEYPEKTRAGLLLHAGEELGWIAEGILAVPWWRLV